MHPQSTATNLSSPTDQHNNATLPGDDNDYPTSFAANVPALVATMLSECLDFVPNDEPDFPQARAAAKECPVCLGGSRAPAFGPCQYCNDQGWVYMMCYPAPAPREAVPAASPDDTIIAVEPPSDARLLLRWSEQLVERLAKAQTRRYADQQLALLRRCVQALSEVLEPAIDEGDFTPISAEKFYVYQLEWNSIPFYVGETGNPAQRLASHCANTWQGLKRRQEQGNYPDFNRVIAAARRGAYPRMRLLEECSSKAESQLAEAAWHRRLRGEGWYIISTATRR